MKAKMYKYIFSILFICISFASKGQTIDNVLYTNFNNYYKWRGGAFDSTFLLPQISATNGKRAGALRYSTADSSVYSWTGNQWVKIGGGDTTSLSNRIDARVKYTDTATMLSPYLRSNVAAATYQPIGNYDTATVVKAYVTNAESVTITKGQVVYIFGAQGDRASVKLAKNTSDTFSSKTLGIVRADIAAGQAGWVTTQGQVSGINLGAYTAGDILWLDSVAGGFTKIKPVAPKHGVFIGIVERANAGNGIIYVKPQNGVELDEVHNVLITSPTNNQVLSYTASTGIWENKSVATALGYTPLNVTDTAAMLSPYARTNTVNAGLATKLNISDTASMLNPYLRSNVAAATYQPIGSYLTSITAPTGAGINLIKGTSQVKRLKAGSGISITDNTDSVTITNIGAVSWQAADTLFAYNQARNGKHINGDFDFITTTNYIGGTGDAQLFDVNTSGTSTDINTGGINAIRSSVSVNNTSGMIFYGHANVLRVFSFASATDPAVVNFRIRLNDLYDATDRFYLQIGLVDAVALNISNGYYFTYDKGQSQTGSAASDNWQCVTSNASARTWTTTGTAVVEDTYITLSIRVATDKVIFYVNGSIVAEHSTNITTANTGMFMRIFKSAGSNARSIDCDYITFDQWYSTLR